MKPISTFVVNLPEDAERLDEIRRQLDLTGFGIKTHIGFLGRMLPDGVCLRLTRDPNSLNNKGALGVMMSHLLIWEHVARLDDAFALVVEDDVKLHNVERLMSATLPAGFDFIFCGDQTSHLDPQAHLTAPLTCMPAAQAMPLLEERRVAVGAYGYLLSPPGARKLLELFTEHFYFGHVDVRMMAYACSLSSLNHSGHKGDLTRELQTVRCLIGEQPVLAGYVMAPALVTHIGMASRRAREDEVGVTGIAAGQDH